MSESTQRTMPHVLDARPDNIWGFAQNKPTLIAKDFEEMFKVPRWVTYQVLVARGVFKWLAVRRDLIKLKNTWRDRITQTIQQIKDAKAYLSWQPTPQSKQQATLKLAYLRGYLKAMEECRKEVRALCHSERWQAPDFDKDAQRHLEDWSMKHTTEHLATAAQEG